VVTVFGIRIARADPEGNFGSPAARDANRLASREILAELTLCLAIFAMKDSGVQRVADAWRPEASSVAVIALVPSGMWLELMMA